MDRNRALALYFGSAVALGVLIPLRALPEPYGFGLVLAVTIGLVIFRARVLKEGAWSGLAFVWAAVFFLAFLPTAWLLGGWPFR